MPPSKILKFLLDIESVIEELERILEFCDHSFDQFNNNFMALRAAERDLMIIGEAVVKMKKIDESISISVSKEIVGLRNLIVHAYDSIDAAILWKILIEDLPTLKIEIQELKSK